MRVAPQDCFEERRAGGQDDPVGLQLVVLAGQRDVEELLLLANVAKGGAYVSLKVVPLETELFRGHCGWLICRRSVFFTQEKITLACVITQVHEKPSRRWAIT